MKNNALARTIDVPTFYGEDPEIPYWWNWLPIGTCTQIVPLDALKSFMSQPDYPHVLHLLHFLIILSCIGSSANVSLHSGDPMSWKPATSGGAGLYITFYSFAMISWTIINDMTL